MWIPLLTRALLPSPDPHLHDLCHAESLLTVQIIPLVPAGLYPVEVIEGPTQRVNAILPFLERRARTLHTASEEAGGGLGQGRSGTAGRAQASL